jgi:pimeloyl-ACP methyl ester carboxylesterase
MTPGGPRRVASQRGRLRIAGLRISYERAGDGPPVVLLHGGLSDAREWRRQLEALSDEFTVVAWDAPGCGGSSDPPASFRLPDYADCLAGLVDALGLDRPHVLGLSFGATLALELYRRRPALPRSLLLASAYAGWAGSLPSDLVAKRLEGVLAELELPPDQIARKLIPDLLTDGAPSALVGELVEIMADLHPAGSRVMARAMAEADLRDVLPRIDVPTLLVYGAEDRRSPAHVAAALAETIPSARLVVVPGVGHQPNLEAPDRFNAEVREFLRASSTPAPRPRG